MAGQWRVNQYNSGLTILLKYHFEMDALENVRLHKLEKVINVQMVENDHRNCEMNTKL